MVTKKQLAALARGRATAARNRAKKGRKNPRRLGESQSDYAKRLEREMSAISTRMKRIEGSMKKLSKLRNPENPNIHFPKTHRGRPPVKRSWNLGLYSPSGSLVSKQKLHCSKAEAEKRAKSASRNKGIHKAILTGPL